MSKVISTFVKEDGSARAEVRQNENGVYEICYQDSRGQQYRTESFEGKSVHYAESAAENWINGIKNLNG